MNFRLIQQALVALEMYREYTPEGNGIAERAIVAIKQFKKEWEETEVPYVVVECSCSGKTTLLSPPQSEKPEQDEVDIRSRLYQRIHELETQLAQPEDKKCENCGEFGECCQDAQPEQEPVAWYDKDGVITANPIEFSQPLYTTSPQPEKLDQDEVDIRSRLYQRIHELETQLAQPEQEPVYWQWRRKNMPWQVPQIFGYELQTTFYKDSEVRKLYTTPPQRKPLTDEDIFDNLNSVFGDPKHHKIPLTRGQIIDFGRKMFDLGTRPCTTPPQRKPLTPEQIADIVIEMNGNEPTAPFWRDLARATEAAHGIKGEE